jgi:epoxyqueuosine reductase
MSLKEEIKEHAYSQGAHLAGMTHMGGFEDYSAEVEARFKETRARLEDFMISPETDHRGRVISDDISFFTRLSDARGSLPTAKTIIVLGVNAFDKAADYGHTRQELRGKTARTYSYYPVVRRIAESVAAFIEKKGHKAIHGQHVPLKFTANRIGLGVYGKNGIFQTKQYGSYIALRNVLTDAELEPDRITGMHSPCDNCDRCLAACPTGALYAPYKVNPKLCINPLTRSDRNIDPGFREKMSNWINGCDICQEVCPSNRNLDPREIDTRSGFDSRHHSSHKYLDGLERTPLLTGILSDKSPEVIRRNAAVALANIGKGRKEAVEAIKKHIVTAPSVLEEYFTRALNILENSKEQKCP